MGSVQPSSPVGQTYVKKIDYNYDDDGNLANGTPHADEIHAAFDRHGIAGARVPQSAACTPPRP